ncbi:hypothetical protein AMJ80_02495 [bacterium SM23_31]|nr:MAG: hypothetical protein AMJ80_02495 [bacterium SM23_31]
MAYWEQVFNIIKKDITIELRAKEAVSAMLVFGLMVIVVFSFAFNLGTREQIEIAPGLLWIAFTFAGILGLNHSFAAEYENHCLQGMMLAPVPRSAVYIGKLTGNFIFMFLAELIMLGFFIWLFDVRFTGRWHLLVLTMILGTLAFAIIGTMFSAVASGIRMREFLLPILQFPVVLPAIIFAVEATADLLEEDTLAGFFDGIKFLSAFNIIFFTLCVLLFEYILED